jgi:hypothetical protein
MKRLFLAASTALMASAPVAAQAQIKLLPECTQSGNCGIADILAVFINIAEYLLGIVGAVALGYFVYGGFVFILSRGSKGEVDRAFGILRSAAIGIFIIFLSGVLVRFTTQALTGGQSAIRTIGETCNSSTQESAASGDGIWVLLPGGQGDGGTKIPEGLVCVKKEDAATKSGDECANLNGLLKERGRTETYTCMDIGSVQQGTCVRGLCSKLPAQYACCRQ